MSRESAHRTIDSCLTRKTSHVGQVSPKSMFEHCDENVVGIFELSHETITRLLGQDTLSEEERSFGDQGFPRFIGSQAVFSTCLEQVLEDIWANEDGKLGAWQQLYMLACVKKWSKDFWTIGGPDTDG